MGIFDQFAAQVAALPRVAPQPQRTGLLGGVQNFLSSNRGEGNFVQRLGRFGAELQDIGDGGSRARTMRADQAAQVEAQRAAAQQEVARATLNAWLRGGAAGPKGAAMPAGVSAAPVQGASTDPNAALPRIRAMAQQAGGVGQVQPSAGAVSQQQQAPQLPDPIRAQIQLLVDQGDIGGATELFNQHQQREARLAALPPVIRNDPLYSWVAATNPEAFAESLGYRTRPQVIAEGGLQNVGGPGGGATYAPRTFVGGGDVFQTQAGGGVQSVANITPSPGDLVAQQNADTARITALRPQAVNTAAGGLTTVLDINGNPVRQIEGREDPTRAAQREERAAAVSQGQERALQVIGNTRAAVTRAREQNSGLSAGVMSNLIPLNQWRANLAGTIETIQANLSFNELAAMRAASPTGGALGSIAVKELELLGATVASLNQNQSPEEFARSLDVIDGAMERWEGAVRQAQQQGQAQPSGPIAQDANGNRVQWNGSAWVPL